MTFRYLALGILASLALGACATMPAPPVSHSRPNAPMYRGSFGAASCVAGSTGIAPAATLTFTPPTTNVDGTPVAGPLTFNLYEGTSAGTETKAATGITSSPTVVNSGLKGNATYYFELTAVDANGNESARSNEVCKTFPVAPPNAVVVTIE